MSKISTTHLTLGTPVEQVRATLTTLSGYHRWNPFITSAAGLLHVGERLDITIQPLGARATGFQPWVTANAPHRYVEWLGRLVVLSRGMLTRTSAGFTALNGALSQRVVSR